MEIRNRKTGEVITVDELRRKHPNVSFPHPITTDILNEYGYDAVMNGPAAEVSGPYEVSVRNGVKKIKGQWFTNYVVGPIFKKYTDDEGKVVTVAKQKKEYRQGIDNRAAESVRKTRNQKLKETDWTQIPDCTVDKTVWKDYRQELRDISKQEGFPHDITWPEEPS